MEICKQTATARFRYFLCGWMLLVCGVLIAQEPAKNQVDEDYTLWHRLEIIDLSDDHKWALYKSATEESDTLLVQATAGIKRYAFANAVKGGFFGSNYFVAHDKEGVQVLHLKTGRCQQFDEAVDFVVAGELLGIIAKSGAIEKLSVFTRELVEVVSINGVEVFKEHMTANSLAAVTIVNGNAALKILQFDRGVVRHYDVSFTATASAHLVWSDDGKNIAFVGDNDVAIQLYTYSIEDQKLQVLKQDLLTSSIELAKNIELHFSHDGRRLFFKGRSKNVLPKHPADAVQVWNAADKWIYPAEQAVMGFTRSPMLLVWEFKRNNLLQVADIVLPNATVLNDHYALLWNPKEYEPQAYIFPPVDLYLADLSTGSRKLVLKNQLGTETNLYGSPDGHRFAYFKEHDWWVYNVVVDSHSNVSKGFSVPLGGEKQDWSDLSRAYGFGGWTPDGKSLLLYDEFDLWRVAVDDKTATRLTQGREISMIYRILRTDDEKQLSMHASKPLIVALGKGLVLKGSSLDHSVNGIYALDKSLKLEGLYVAEKRIYNFFLKDDVLLWIAERYDASPQLLFKRGSLKPKVIAYSNTHPSGLARRMEVVHYNAPTGQPLRGLLYYPFDYEHGRKYPLITHVYELQSDKLHQYVMPSKRDGRGFSIGMYLSKGYFVLLPDIAYEFDLIGQSAVRCVEAALDEAARVAPIDTSKVGLIGQSFGGYETAFIVTQSDRFACAVAGAAPTDLLSGALAEARNNKRPNFFKFEGGQFRMTASAADNMAAYIDNSPVAHVRNVATPLLSWTGLEDTQVESTQSFELYMAMRRLGKEHVLLAYPKEGHELDTVKNIADLYQKIEDWMDHYLKCVPKTAWMYPTL